MHLQMALVAALGLAVLISGVLITRRLITKLLFILIFIAFGISAYQMGWQCGASEIVRMVTGQSQQADPKTNSNTGSIPIKS